MFSWTTQSLNYNGMNVRLQTMTRYLWPSPVLCQRTQSPFPELFGTVSFIVFEVKRNGTVRGPPWNSPVSHGRVCHPKISSWTSTFWVTKCRSSSVRVWGRFCTGTGSSSNDVYVTPPRRTHFSSVPRHKNCIGRFFGPPHALWVPFIRGFSPWVRRMNERLSLNFSLSNPFNSMCVCPFCPGKSG